MFASTPESGKDATLGPYKTLLAAALLIALLGCVADTPSYDPARDANISTDIGAVHMWGPTSIQPGQPLGRSRDEPKGAVPWQAPP